jgi:hypothetical protein
LWGQEKKEERNIRTNFRIHSTGKKKKKKRMQERGKRIQKSEFTAKDSVAPASVFLHTPAVGLRHLHGAAVPLVLQSAKNWKKKERSLNTMADAWT